LKQKQDEFGENIGKL